MTINLFGLTPALVAARAQGVVSSASASPNTTAFEAILKEVANDWAISARNVGIDVSTVTEETDETLFVACRSAVVNGCIDRYILSRDPRNTPVDRPYLALWQSALETLRKMPTVFRLAEQAPNTFINLNAETYAYNGRNAIPGLPGKVVRGGL